MGAGIVVIQLLDGEVREYRRGSTVRQGAGIVVGQLFDGGAGSSWFNCGRGAVGLSRMDATTTRASIARSHARDIQERDRRKKDAKKERRRNKKKQEEARLASPP